MSIEVAQGDQEIVINGGLVVVREVEGVGSVMFKGVNLELDGIRFVQVVLLQEKWSKRIAASDGGQTLGEVVKENCRQ